MSIRTGLTLFAVMLCSAAIYVCACATASIYAEGARVVMNVLGMF